MDLASPDTAPTARPGEAYGPRRALAVWLFACCAVLFAIVVVGGVTRLTHSGLSIVEWKPVIGILPPLSQAQWEAEFVKYQATPEYQLVNRGMSLEAFKGIFWWEYVHRVLARAIGLAFAVPLAVFAWRGWIDRPLLLRLLGILALGGLQGALGWYMVASGLVDEPRVSHFRLAAHLGLAFLIFAAMLWTALGLMTPASPARPGAIRHRGLARLAAATSALVFVLVLSGALVAGIRAGKAYNTWPLMNGHLVPPEILMIDPAWKNFFYNMATVQFDHRLLAYAVLARAAALWWRVRRAGLQGGARGASLVLLGVTLAQVGLGIATLLHQVPVALGAAHQGVALGVFAASIWLAHALAREA